MIKTLHNICYFSNFVAKRLALIPFKNNIESNLLNKNSTFINNFIRKNNNDKIVVFGDYKTDKLFTESIIRIHHIQPPSIENAGNNSNVLIADSWAYTIEYLFHEFCDSQHTFLLTSEFLSTLEDPRPLLLALKKILLRPENKSKILLIHSENMHDAGYRGWDQKSLELFFHSSGFEIDGIDNKNNKLSFFTLSLNERYYINYLESITISRCLFDATLLLLTTQDATILPEGGIGTYIKNIKDINPSVAVFFCRHRAPARDVIDTTFFIEDFVDDIDWENVIDGIGLIELVKSILYTLPNLTTIEFQDYNAPGFRIVQAKKTGILPHYLVMRVFLHGNIDYTKYGTQNNDAMNYDFHEAKLTVKDSYIFENVDQCFIPSAYLKTLMQNEFGYKLNNPAIHRLPFGLESISENDPIKISNIDQIVYIGKYSELKGWFDFVDAIDYLLENKKIAGVKKVISLTSDEQPETKEHNILTKHVDYDARQLTHQKLMTFINTEKNHTLFIAPSRGESFSFVVLEQLLLGTLFIGYNSGGAIEVVDDKSFTDRFFCEPDSVALADKIEEILHGNFENHSLYLNKFKKIVYQRQEKTNRKWLEITSKAQNIAGKMPDCTLVNDETSVVVPVYNTAFEYIHDLIKSLNALQAKPEEIIWINDGSSAEYTAKLEKVIASELNLPYRMVLQKNKGLAGARNRGLMESRTKYTFFIDSDDLLLPHSLSFAWISMHVNPQLVATSGFAGCFHNFSDTENYLRNIYRGTFWKPIGLSTAKAISLYENQFIAACCLIKTEEIKKLGGWDESDNSTWEDWGFYTRLAWEGYEFSLTPCLGYLHRDTPDSMSKTYNHYFGRRRLIRNLPGFSRMDANILISLINNHVISNSLKVSDTERDMLMFKRRISQNPVLKKSLKQAYRFIQNSKRLWKKQK